MANAWSPPELTTAAEPLLELNAQGLNCAAANGGARLGHRLIMQMVAMVANAVYFACHNLLDFGGARGWAFKPFLQAPYDSRLLSVTQTLQEFWTHSLALAVPSPYKAWPTAQRCWLA